MPQVLASWIHGVENCSLISQRLSVRSALILGWMKLSQGRRLVVVEEREVDDDLVGDITEVLTSMCARLYGRRSARRRAERAVQAAGEAV